MITARQAKKLQYINNGCYAQVYQHPDDTSMVVKVVCYRTRYCELLEYYRHSLNTYKYWAKIYDMKLPTRKYSPVVMIQEKIPFMTGWNSRRPSLDESLKSDPDLKFFIFVLKEICDRHNLDLDLHGGNYGYREDDSIAIFDPYC